MGKSPIPKPHDWDNWSLERKLSYIEENFIKPKRMHERMAKILLFVTLFAIIIFFIYVIKM